MREIFYVSCHIESPIVIAVPNDAICLINLVHSFFSALNHVCKLFLIAFLNAVSLSLSAQCTVYIQSTHFARTIKQIIINARKKSNLLFIWLAYSPHCLPSYLAWLLLRRRCCIPDLFQTCRFLFLSLSNGAFFLAACELAKRPITYQNSNPSWF